MKICVACSAGGHLTEVLHVKKCYSKYPHFFITFKRVDTAELGKREKTYFIGNPGRNVIKFLKCIYRSFKILRKEKPDVILTTGAGVAVPACYLGKLFFNSKVIYIESICRIEEPSLCGRVLYPIADLFLVQWKNMLSKYGKKAVYKGAIV